MTIDSNAPDECTSYSFTPVRRRPSSLPQGYLHGDVEKEWTANRCHRLLRPLTSRIALLQKDISRSLSSCAVAPQYQRPQNTNQVRCETEDVELEDSQASDAEWRQQPAKKRVKRTYSSKCTKGGRANANEFRGRRASSQTAGKKLLAPGEIAVPTPMLSRTKRNFLHEETEPPSDLLSSCMHKKRSRSRRANSQDCESYLKLLELRKTTSITRYNTYEGIYNGLEVLLKATNNTSQATSSKGAKSLLSTCLKSVPQYIAEEKEIMYAEAEENGSISAFQLRDISSEVYDELESMGTANRGWKHLKAVVRSHGIYLLSNAIQKSLLDGRFCAVLLSLALEMDSQDAAEAMLSSAFSVQKISIPPTAYSHLNDISTCGPMAVVWNYIYHRKISTYQYRQVAKMLTGSMLPVEWLASKDVGRIWTSAIQVLASSSCSNADATEFVRVALTMLGRTAMTSNDATNLSEDRSQLAISLQQTYSSVLTTLSTIAILSKDTAQRLEIRQGSESAAEYDNIIQILQNCLAERSLAHSTTQRALLLLTLALIESSDQTTNTHNTHVDSLVNILVQERQSLSKPLIYQAVVRFLCSTAHCCARGTSTSTLEHIRGLHHALDDLASCSTIPGAVIVFELIVDSALAFSEQDPTRKHLDYAASVELKYDDVAIEPRNSSCQNVGQTTGEGFRWEEGISEWVTATPAVHIAKHSHVMDYEIADEAVCDTPLRSYPTRQKNADVSEVSKSNRAARSISEQKEVDTEQAETTTGSPTKEKPLLPSSVLAMGRKTIPQVPVTERKIPKRKNHSFVQAVQVFQDESDDELSFLSCASTDDRSLRVVTNLAQSRQTRHPTIIKGTKQRRATKSITILHDDSEDELCI